MGLVEGEKMNERQEQLVRDKLVVALDLEEQREALNLVEGLRGRVRRFKVGSRMFTRYGPDFLDELAARDAELFVDLKFHDIPNTVEGAVEAIAEREEVFLSTIHAAGGRAMVRSAARAAGGSGLDVVAVTALTSLEADDVRAVAGGGELEEWVDDLAELALGAGADGLVCSPRELEAFRSGYGTEPILVTPGIRPEPSVRDDQKRTATPAEALEAGSDYLVVGRPIYEAEDPAAAVDAIGESL